METTWDETIHSMLVEYVDLVLEERSARLLDHPVKRVEK
jgi:hypothetical protein